MNLATIDLNLLVAFEALSAEENVTRAGNRIGLSQSSMSNTLVRMRKLFGDELFIRTARGMLPTPRAMEIAPLVCRALAQVRDMFQAVPPFDPGTTERSFTISVSDYGSLIVMPAVIAALRAGAPGINLRIRSLRTNDLTDDLDAGETDLAIGGHLATPQRCEAFDLFQERFVCIMDPGHPAAASGLDPGAFTSFPHILFSRDSANVGAADEALSAIGLKRRVAVVIPHVTALSFTIRGTDLLAMISERVALRLRDLSGVLVSPLPLEIPSFSVKLVHSRRLEQDPGLLWLKSLIRTVASGI
jgi:DNA-binding transcriptional LysR family regulator